MADQRFPTRIDSRFAPILRVLFGVRPANSYVELTDAGVFFASYGRVHLETPIGNIVSWRLEGPWSSLTALGVRVGWRKRDVTFGGSAHGGVRVDFRKQARASILDTPALYVTVDDLEGLAAALTACGIPGTDARTKVVP